MPIKRNEHLLPLSRDHHFGLLFCWKIRQGIKIEIDTGRILKFINNYWESNLRQHFTEEETILFNPINDRLCRKGIDQHKEIADLLKYINESGDIRVEDCNSLAYLVDAHIRFEERELFPHLESVLTIQQLAIVGEQIKSMHSEAPNEDYPDELWVKAKYGKSL